MRHMRTKSNGKMEQPVQATRLHLHELLGMRLYGAAAANVFTPSAGRCHSCKTVASQNPVSNC
jgi:hypothetical protein